MFKKYFNTVKKQVPVLAVLVADGFDQLALQPALAELIDSGVHYEIVSPHLRSVRAWNNSTWGEKITVNVPLKDASSRQFHGLYIPSGLLHVDHLRTSSEAIQLVKKIVEDGLAVIAAGHGPLLFIDSQVASDRRLTSDSSVRVDLQNAGAEWTDAEFVLDRTVLTVSSLSDLKTFSRLTSEILTQVSNKDVSRQVITIIGERKCSEFPNRSDTRSPPVSLT